MRKIVGYVFPIQSQHAKSIFELGKNVFSKFSRYRKLRAGMKAIFYVSGKKYLVGEACIKRVERMTTETLWRNYSTALFLTKKELFDYAKMSPLGIERKTKELSVYVLEDIKKYIKPKYIKRKMTPSGYYMTENEYLSI